VITGTATIVRVSVAVAVPEVLVALNVTVDVLPGPVGVPEITPVAVFTVKPAGNPVAPKLTGVLVAVIWYEKAVPTVPPAVLGLVITGSAVMVSVSIAVPVPALLVALSVTPDVPALVGVPEIKPEVVLTVRPVGNTDAAKLAGKLAAVIWYEKALPVVPLAVALLVITGASKVTVRVSGALPVPALLVALIVTLKAPGAVGVPEIIPVAAFTVRPAGNPEAPKLAGELLAVIW
jgi:hypothetical protein